MEGGAFPQVSLQPVTQAIAASSMAMAIATEMGLLKIPSVLFIPGKIASQPWRLYTSYCYFGNLDLSFIQQLFMVSQTNNALERAYMVKLSTLPRKWYKDLDEMALERKFEENRSWDFAYFLFRITFSIVACLLIANRWYDITERYLILGPTMKGVLLYIKCRNKPEDVMLFLGIKIKAKYAPFIEKFVVSVLSNEFQTLMSVRKDYTKAIFQFLQSGFVMTTIFEFLIAHFWWFVEFVYLSQTNSQARWEAACVRVAHESILESFGIMNVFRCAITPPWYFFITSNMRAGQQRAQDRSTVEGADDAVLQDTAIDNTGDDGI